MVLNFEVLKAVKVGFGIKMEKSTGKYFPLINLMYE